MNLSHVYQITIVFSYGSFNRFSCTSIPRVGDEISVVHGSGKEETFKITRVKLRAYRSIFDTPRPVAESDAILWGDLISDEGYHS